MASSVRMRIELADRPGSLAGIAAAIAARDGNITAIDVLEADGGRVVDEITVEVPGDLDMAQLRKDIAAVEGARVLSHRRAEVVDPIVRVIRRVTDTLERLPADPAEVLRQGVADLCATPTVWVLDADGAAPYAFARLALNEPRRALLARTAEELPSPGETVTGDARVVAVATTLRGTPCVAVVARPASQGFTPTECHRIEALVDLYAHLLEMPR